MDQPSSIPQADAPPDLPTRRPRLSWAARFASAWYFVLGAVATIVGAHEVVFALSLTFRLAGIVMLTVGMALLASSVGFVKRRSWCYTSSFLSGVAAGVLALLLLIAQLLNYPIAARVALWAAVAVLSFTAAFFVAREGRVNFGNLARRRVQVASSLLSVGAILSVAQFWNTAVRVPPAAAPSIAIANELHQAKSTKKGLVAVEGDITLRNTASTKIWIMGAMYNVLGGMAGSGTSSRAQFAGDVDWMMIHTSPGYDLDRHAYKTFTHVVDTGRLIADLFYLVPGDQQTFHFVLYVPPERYDFLRLQTSVAVAKDTLALDDTKDLTPRKVTIGRVGRVVAERPIRETSWVGRLLRGSGVVIESVVMDHSNGYLFPYLSISIERKGRPLSDSASSYALHMQRLYGLAYSDSAYELPMP
jgi:hypothetical protein